MGVSRWISPRKLRQMSIQINLPGWGLESVPFFAHEILTASPTHLHISGHPICATKSTDPTAVSASDVAGDTPWTSLGPIFLGNLPISQTTPPQQPHASRDSVERFSRPAARIFVFLRQTMVNIVPSYHPIARAKLSGQAKQRDALVFGHDFAPNIYFFGHDFASNRRSFGGSPLQ